jgi:hypothetical protein
MRTNDRDQNVSSAHTRSSQVNPEALRLAEISLMNGCASEGERDSALWSAERAGVTTSEYLRARLLVEAGIAVLERGR